MKKHTFNITILAIFGFFLTSCVTTDKMANRYTSPPGGSSHQYGGAVDVTLIDAQGNRLDMGTALTDYGKKVHTENSLITEGQRQNRKLLYKAMTDAGFVNYPLEWWHYSYGDRMWAAYTLKSECFYGPIADDSSSNNVHSHFA